MKDCMICFYNAFGDNIHMSVIIDELKKKYNNVYIDANWYSMVLFARDPRIKKISYYEPSLGHSGSDVIEGIRQHIQKVREKYSDRDVIDFFGFTDHQFFDTEIAPWTFKERRRVYGVNWHEEFFRKAGLEMPADFTASYPSISFDPIVLEEVEKQWYKPNKNYFRILVPLGGSTRNKGFPSWMADFCKMLVDSLDRVKIFTLGDESCASMEWKHDRTVHLSHRKDRPTLPMVNAIIMTKFANYVLGPETGILSAAGMWGTPKTTLCTCSSVSQLCKYHYNDFSMQAQVECSPCYRTCYEGPGRVKEPCPRSEEILYPMLPQCTDKGSFDLDRLFGYINAEYERWEAQKQQ